MPGVVNFVCPFHPLVSKLLDTLQNTLRITKPDSMLPDWLIYYSQVSLQASCLMQLGISIGKSYAGHPRKYDKKARKLTPGGIPNTRKLCPL